MQIGVFQGVIYRLAVLYHVITWSFRRIEELLYKSHIMPQPNLDWCIPVKNLEFPFRNKLWPEWPCYKTSWSEFSSLKFSPSVANWSYIYPQLFQIVSWIWICFWWEISTLFTPHWVIRNCYEINSSLIDLRSP